MSMAQHGCILACVHDWFHDLTVDILWSMRTGDRYTVIIYPGIKVAM
jgi:hypothetical protein